METRLLGAVPGRGGRLWRVGRSVEGNLRGSGEVGDVYVLNGLLKEFFIKEEYGVGIK